MRHYVTVTEGGKGVGVYDTELKKYEKLVQRKRHRFWKLDAYGISVVVLDKLREQGCELVEIFESDTGEKFISKFKDWEDAPIEEHGEHGKQRFLAVKKMFLVVKHAPPKV